MDNSSLETSFDFNSQSGVMALLTAIRLSQITTTQKNELRDLVFLFSNGGGDATVRLSLEQKIATYQIKPIVVVKPEIIVETPPENAVVLPFGSSRPVPKFETVAVPEVTKVATADVVTPVVDSLSSNVTIKDTPVVASLENPVVAPVAVVTEVLPVSASINPVAPVLSSTPVIPPPVQTNTVPVQPKSIPETTASVPEVQPIPTQPVVQQPAVSPVSIPTQPIPPVISKEPEVVASPVFVTTPPVVNELKNNVVTKVETSVPPVVYADADVTTKHLNRIREIKSAVNNKVGNPVNLVDIDNAVGREYMNALLDAMKRLSGGLGQLEPAMQRLEIAYEMVETAVMLNAKSPAKNTVAPVASVYKTNPQTTPETKPETKPNPAQNNAPVNHNFKPVTKMKLVDVPLSREGDNRWNIKPSSPIPSPAVPVASNSGFSATPVQSVADEKDLSISEPAQEGYGSVDVVDALHTEEIDKGLDQLLSDWVLFKKSGLFGTGPKGREHPLFKKVAPLQLQLLLAGRFEGSTQEIKQSVTDYMNGWRYEQGIVYEQGETFEHYLRRVIKQIIDLQNNQRTS